MSSPPAIAISKSGEQKIVSDFTNGANFSGFEQTVKSIKKKRSKRKRKRDRLHRLKERALLTLSSDEDERIEKSICGPEFLASSPQTLPRGSQEIIHDAGDLPGITIIVHNDTSDISHNPRIPQKVAKQVFRVMEPDMDEEEFMGVPNEEEGQRRKMEEEGGRTKKRRTKKEGQRRMRRKDEEKEDEEYPHTPHREAGQEFRVLEPNIDKEFMGMMPNEEERQRRRKDKGERTKKRRTKKEGQKRMRRKDEEKEEEEYPEFDYPEEEDDEVIAEMSLLLNRRRNLIDQNVFKVGEVYTRPIQFSANALCCRSIRVGSYQILPQSTVKGATVQVQLLPIGFRFECVGTNFGDIIIKALDIKMCHLFEGRTLPVLFIDTTPEFANKVRTQLTLTNNDYDQYRFDPLNKDPFVRKITFLASIITQHQVTFLKECFPGIRLIQVLTQKSANGMLVTSTQTENKVEMLFQRRKAEELLL